MNFSETMARAMAMVADGHEDEETGEINKVDEIKITWEVKGKGDFEIIVRRPKTESETE